MDALRIAIWAVLGRPRTPAPNFDVEKNPAASGITVPGENMNVGHAVIGSGNPVWQSLGKRRIKDVGDSMGDRIAPYHGCR